MLPSKIFFQATNFEKTDKNIFDIERNLPNKLSKKIEVERNVGKIFKKNLGLTTISEF